MSTLMEELAEQNREREGATGLASNETFDTLVIHQGASEDMAEFFDQNRLEDWQTLAHDMALTFNKDATQKDNWRGIIDSVDMYYAIRTNISNKWKQPSCLILSELGDSQYDVIGWMLENVRSRAEQLGLSPDITDAELVDVLLPPYITRQMSDAALEPWDNMCAQDSAMNIDTMSSSEMLPFKIESGQKWTAVDNRQYNRKVEDEVGDIMDTLKDDAEIHSKLLDTIDTVKQGYLDAYEKQTHHPLQATEEELNSREWWKKRFGDDAEIESLETAADAYGKFVDARFRAETLAFSKALISDVMLFNKYSNMLDPREREALEDACGGHIGLSDKTFEMCKEMNMLDKNGVDLNKYMKKQVERQAEPEVETQKQSASQPEKSPQTHWEHLKETMAEDTTVVAPEDEPVETEYIQGGDDVRIRALRPNREEKVDEVEPKSVKLKTSSPQVPKGQGTLDFDI